MDWRADIEKLRRRKPRHILFLCVANSARSQLAEGIARFYAPADVVISSAGSAPTHIRLEVIEVLREIGIDATPQFSKSLDDIAVSTVEAVITLCAEEACPVFPGNVDRYHWPLADPAAIVGDLNDRLRAFRQVRDELTRRIRQMF